MPLSAEGETTLSTVSAKACGIAFADARKHTAASRGFLSLFDGVEGKRPTDMSLVVATSRPRPADRLLSRVAARCPVTTCCGMLRLGAPGR
jgi:hypothetical protein